VERFKELIGFESHQRSRCRGRFDSMHIFWLGLSPLHSSPFGRKVAEISLTRGAMTGEDRATLQGFAIPLAPAMDHTYVASSCGLRWSCFGRDDNGAMICTGSGSSKLANCLSQVDSRASIIYGITGVCHQAQTRRVPCPQGPCARLLPAGGRTTAHFRAHRARWAQCAARRRSSIDGRGSYCH
jgi:hypothetical protein